MTPTDRGSNILTGTTATTDVSLGTPFTPAVGSLLRVFNVIYVNANNADLSVADTFGDSGTWSKATEQFHDSGNGYVYRMCCFTKIVGASPVSGTITSHRIITPEAALDSFHYLQCDEVSGQNATPIRQTTFGTSAASTLTATFTSPGTPLSTSWVSGFVITDATSGISVGAGYTQRDENFGGGWGAGVNVEYTTNPSSANVDWSALGTANNTGIAIEIAAATVMGTSIAWVTA